MGHYDDSVSAHYEEQRRVEDKHLKDTLTHLRDFKSFSRGFCPHQCISKYLDEAEKELKARLYRDTEG